MYIYILSVKLLIDHPIKINIVSYYTDKSDFPLVFVCTYFHEKHTYREIREHKYGKNKVQTQFSVV
jgi:hypothetical protein